MTDDVLDQVGAAFSRLRRRTGKVDVESPVGRKDMSRNIVLNIVDEAGGEMTVGGVADQLTVDPSVASRMVADCISAGYLRREASQADGRRTVLALTDAGHSLQQQFRAQHREAFLKITADWPQEKRLTFAHLLVEYADAAAAYTNKR